MDKPDPIERKMGKRVVDMVGSELAAYVKEYLGAYGMHLPTDTLIDRKIMEAFRKRYGPENAGKIVQHVMLKHGGKKGEEYITMSCFSKGMKWWTDKMWLEVQEAKQREEAMAVTEADASEGWFDATQLGGAR